MRLVLIWLIGLSWVYTSASPPLLSTNDLHHLRQALDELIMTETDLSFDKDFGEHRYLMPDAMQVLKKPLVLPTIGDAYLEAVRENTLINLAMEKFGTNSTVTLSDSPRTTQNEHIYFAANFWSDTLQIDRYPEEIPIIKAAVSTFKNHRASAIYEAQLAEPDTLDPEPSAKRTLALLDKMNVHSPITFLEMCEQLHHAKPNALPRLWTSTNIIWGTMGNDVYTNANSIIIDPGGDDIYTGLAGVGFEGWSIIIDKGGNDQYLGNGLLGPGSAVFGNSYIYDASGDDVYKCSHLGIASALGGFAHVEDVDGHDHYEAKAFAQGAAYAGLATLIDRRGDDTYKLGYLGQAYAGVLGHGYLVDYAGNDTYLAGGHYIDHGHHEDRFMSMAQGFSIGMRPYAAGGIAALIDLGGNDFYKADVWGQAVSYWYALGMLIDADGNDTYSMYHYGQGSGIHLSSALLADLGGNDFYTGYALAQGNAHDYAVGMLLDHAGNDHYTANHYSQGRGMTNGFGLLLDRKGMDGYFSVRCDRSQGIGSDGWQREYGSIALLIDILGKNDIYSCGGKNNFKLVRPNHGVIYDAE